MAQLDSFGAYVRQRLEHWGRAFALHRDCEYLGHRSKDRLQVLIEHGGEMPPRATGFKPLETPPLEQQIEDIVSDIAHDDVVMACVLRGYYCGSGRRKFERYEATTELLVKVGRRPISVRKYMTIAELGFQRVRGRLEGLVRAA